MSSSNSSSGSNISRNETPKKVFQSDYIYPDWFTPNDYKFYIKLVDELKKLRYLHTRSSEHFNKLNYYIFGPSISITAVTGVASFLATSTLVTTEVQTAFGISVGILASISTMLQSIGSSCKFSAKADSHRQAAEEYIKLLTRLEFEMEMPNEKEFADEMEKLILEIKNKCNYFVPQFIIDEYCKKKKCKHEKKPKLKIINNDGDKCNENNNSNLGEKSNLLGDYNTFNRKPDITITNYDIDSNNTIVNNEGIEAIV
jgi:hypothetical protein